MAYDPGRHGVHADDRSIEDLSAALGTILADEVAAARLPADLLADDRRADRLRGPDPPDRHGADGRCQQPLRGRRARRPDGRAGHGLPRGRGQRRQRPRAGHVPQRQPLAADARVRPVPPDGADGDLPPPRHRARAARHRAHRARGGPGPAAAATQRRRVPPGGDAPRGRRRRRRERRPPAALRDPLRHRQDRPVARPGRDPPRPVARRPARPPGAGGPLERHDRRRGRRDRRAAGRRPRAGHHRRPGLPARPTGPRAARRGARPRLADARGDPRSPTPRTVISASWGRPPPDAARAGPTGPPDVASLGTPASTIPQGALPSATRNGDRRLSPRSASSTWRSASARSGRWTACPSTSPPGSSSRSSGRPAAARRRPCG